jgi:hypothetical protein
MPMVMTSRASMECPVRHSGASAKRSNPESRDSDLVLRTIPE